MRKLLRVRYGEKQWERYSPPAGTLLFLQGNYVRVRRGGWTSPSPLHQTVGKWGFMQISQHFGSDQESLTSMQATSPAGRRQPGAGNNSYSHTDITEPHTPLTRLGDGKAPENKRWSFQPRFVPIPTPQMATGQGRASYILNSLKDILFCLEILYHVHNTDKLHLVCSPQITYFKVNTSKLPNAVIIVQTWGFFQEKNIWQVLWWSAVCVSLGRPVSNDSTKHSSRCCREGILWMWLTSIIRTSVEEITLNTVVASSSQSKALRAKPEASWRKKKFCLKIAGSAPAWSCSLQACLSDFTFTQLDPTTAWASSLR